MPRKNDRARDRRLSAELRDIERARRDAHRATAAADRALRVARLSARPAVSR